MRRANIFIGPHAASRALFQEDRAFSVAGGTRTPARTTANVLRPRLCGQDFGTIALEARGLRAGRRNSPERRRTRGRVGLRLLTDDGPSASGGLWRPTRGRAVRTRRGAQAGLEPVDGHATTITSRRGDDRRAARGPRSGRVEGAPQGARGVAACAVRGTRPRYAAPVARSTTRALIRCRSFWRWPRARTVQTRRRERCRRPCIEEKFAGGVVAVAPSVARRVCSHGPAVADAGDPDQRSNDSKRAKKKTTASVLFLRRQAGLRVRHVLRRLSSA